jgi:hypothetical protein
MYRLCLIFTSRTKGKHSLNYTISYKIEPSFSHTETVSLSLLSTEDNTAPRKGYKSKARDITSYISMEQRHAILTWISTLKTGIVHEPMMGLDGTLFTLRIESDAFTSVEYCWWGALPTEWHDLKPILSILNQFVTTAELEDAGESA